jgi:hypothetical protein
MNLKVGDIVTDDDGGAGKIVALETQNDVWGQPKEMADVYWMSTRQYCWCYVDFLRKLDKETA